MVFLVTMTHCIKYCLFWWRCHHELRSVPQLRVLCFSSFSLTPGHDSESAFPLRRDALGRSLQTAWIIVVMFLSVPCSLLLSFHQICWLWFQIPALGLTWAHRLLWVKICDGTTTKASSFPEPIAPTHKQLMPLKITWFIECHFCILRINWHHTTESVHVFLLVYQRTWLHRKKKVTLH